MLHIKTFVYTNLNCLKFYYPQSNRPVSNYSLMLSLQTCISAITDWLEARKDL